MAQQMPMINVGGSNLPPEIMQQQQALNRQQQMAQLLMQQGQSMPSGQMVSGRYVAPSFFQYAAPLFQSYAGTKLAEKGDKTALDLAKQLRQQYASEAQQYQNILRGQEQTFEQAGPTQTGGNIPNQTYRTGADPQAAYLFGSTAYNPVLQQASAKKMLEGPIKVGIEDTLIDPTTMKPIFTGAGKPRAPLQIDTGTAIELRDPANPTVILQSIPKSQMPAAGQVVERDDGTFVVDTRTGQARPVMGQGGQPLTGGGKPLTEAQGNSVAFGARAIEANRIVTELEKAGTTNTGIVRGAIGGTVGMTPFVGEKMQQAVQSTMNVLPNFAGGPNEMQQQTDQGRRNFISAVLRKESGAAIPADEYANEEKKYFPQVGDGPKVIKQKQEARNLAIESLKAQAGPSGVRQINQITSQTQGGNTQLSQQDQEALNWANANPNDSRSAQIKQRLGR